jgi:ribose transport system ATP-binding protein
VVRDSVAALFFRRGAAGHGRKAWGYCGDRIVTAPPLLEARGLRKQFPGVLALDGVSLRIDAGEVLAVVGENGAGKSTLMKILAGIHRPDAGELFLDGRATHFADVTDALAHGINLIHQELNLAENLSVAANLFLGHEETRLGWLGWIDRRPMERAARGLLDRVGLRCSPGTRVDTLRPGQKQLVEIARALGMEVRILIMDEPTSSLTQAEADRLFEVIADLKRSGVAVIYISHRLAEVRQVADRVTVLRDGHNAGDLERSEISHDNLVRLMVGRDLQQFYSRQHAGPVRETERGGAVRLEVRGLRYADGPEEPVSFTVRAGEVLCLAGLVGAGRTELAEALFGIRPVTAGEVRIDGEPVRIRHPGEAIAAGLFLVPEDRRMHGLLLPFTVRHNLALPNLAAVSAGPFIVPARESDLAGRLSEKLHVRSAGLGQVVGQLSGGNQQKVVLGKWLAETPRVLILDEPTRGVDVGARGEIYALIDRLAGAGVAVLMISSDMEEVLGMSDRVLVLHQGRLTGELARGELSEEAVMHLATGGAPS